MALLHGASAPAAPECLELFKVAETQTGVVRTYMLELHPVSSQEGGTAEFHLRPDSPDYGHLKQMKLYGKLRIVHADGSLLGPNEMVMPINLYMHTIWKQVDIKLGNVILSHPQQMYGYKAVIKTLLRRGRESKQTQGASEGYMKDVAGQMDTANNELSTTAFERGQLFQLSSWVDFEGHLLEDCLEIDRYLLNNVPVSVKLTPASSEFAIVADDPTKKYKLQVSDLCLKMCMATVSPGVLLGHAAALKESNAYYPFTRIETLGHSIAKGTRNTSLSNFSTKSVPTRLVFAMVSADAFNGALDKNPFNFQHYNITDISLVVNDVVVGGQPLRVNFDSSNGRGRDYVTAYNNMFSTTGTEGADFGNNISLEDYANGYALFCFNLEPFAKPGKYLNLIKTGYVRLSLQFAEPLPETIVLVVFTEHQDMFQIDAAKNIILS